MKSASPLRTKSSSGITVLELAIVLVVLLSLVGIMLVGTTAWRRAGDRTACVINLRNLQSSVRAYQNIYGYNAGTLPYAEEGSQSIADHLVRKGYIDPGLHSQVKGERACPGGGRYAVPREDVFPLPGSLYAKCSLADSRKHFIPGEADW